MIVLLDVSIQRYPGTKSEFLETSHLSELVSDVTPQNIFMVLG